MTVRIERDAMGEISVASEVYWGAQTQRSLTNFKIGNEKMPVELLRSIVKIKAASALANVKVGKLTAESGKLIAAICADILQVNSYEKYFPLSVWQTGSGTQTNMNVNEVIAHLAFKKEPSLKLNPNDDINLSQSSNDVFPSAMKMASYHELSTKLLPEIEAWLKVLTEKEEAYGDVIKIGRTHLQDATPLTFGQEISAWRVMLEKSKVALDLSGKNLLNLALGGTAVGTGINAPQEFGEIACGILATSEGIPYQSEENKFYALTSYQDLSFFHGGLRSLAGDLMKIANDIRWLASGPRAGVGEITIPSNEPGSSIMPGKVNPTQAEALTMIAVQVMGNDTTIQVAASQGNFQLNVFKPVIIYNLLQSLQLLTDGMRSFRENCLVGIRPNEGTMKQHLADSLMLVTALTPVLGYQASGEIAHYAFTQNISIQAAAEKLTDLDQATLVKLLNPENMIQ